MAREMCLLARAKVNNKANSEALKHLQWGFDQHLPAQNTLGHSRNPGGTEIHPQWVSGLKFCEDTLQEGLVRS